MRSSVFVAALCLLLAVPSNGISKKRRKKRNNYSTYERRRACQTDTCGHLVPLEANNCVNECVSPDCYRKTFAEPLEDGEVNVQLHKNFNACARRETKSTAFTQKNTRKQFADTKNAATSGSKPGVTREESRVLPTGVLEDSAAEFVPVGDDDRLVEQDGGRLGSGGGSNSEEEEEDEDEEEDGEDFDEAYDEVAGLEGAVML